MSDLYCCKFSFLENQSIVSFKPSSRVYFWFQFVNDLSFSFDPNNLYTSDFSGRTLIESETIFALGFITSAAGQVLSFYFGSSQGSKDKTEEIKGMLKRWT